MRTAILLFLAALVCVALAWWVSLLPGSVTATVAGVTFQASTPITLTLLAILFLLLYLLIRLLAWLISIPRRSRRWNSARNQRRGEAALNRALIALAADDSAAARREAERSRRMLGDTPITLLLTAQSYRLAGNEDAAAALYKQLSERPDARLLGLRGLLRLAVERQDWDSATAIAGTAEKAHPRARWLRTERGYMAHRTGDWGEALRLAGPDGRAALATAASLSEPAPRAGLSLAKQAFEADPSLSPAAIAYAERLREAGRNRTAQDVLRQAWSAGPHPDLANAYLEGIGDPVQRARDLAVLVRANPDNVESYLAIGRAALDAGMFADAKHQVERARQAGINDKRLWTLLADINVTEGDAMGAQDALRQGGDADPSPIWRCTNCGTQYDQWHPVCDTCRATGTIRWTHPTSSDPTRYRVLPSPGLEGLTT